MYRRQSFKIKIRISFMIEKKKNSWNAYREWHGYFSKELRRSTKKAKQTIGLSSNTSWKSPQLGNVSITTIKTVNKDFLSEFLFANRSMIWDIEITTVTEEVSAKIPENTFLFWQ